MRYTNMNVHMRKCQCVCMFISYGYMCMNIYFIWTFKYIVDMFNFYMTCVLMRMPTYLRTHACTVFNVGKRVCDGCRFYSFIFLTIYVNHHICLPYVWFVFQRHGLTLRRFILLFIDTVCFTCMYFVSNDNIKTEVNYKTVSCTDSGGPGFCRCWRAGTGMFA